jgi:predicted nucleic acid-binding Zn ribbon protein
MCLFAVLAVQRNHDAFNCTSHGYARRIVQKFTDSLATFTADTAAVINKKSFPFTGHYIEPPGYAG